MNTKIYEKAVRDEAFYKTPLYKTREIRTIRDMFDSSTELFSDKTAFLVKDTTGAPYREITYKQAKSDVYALGTEFISMELKDKKIAVVGENRYEWAITYLATVCGVGTIVPLDKELPEEELKYLIERSGVSAVVYSAKVLKKYPEILKDNDDYVCISMDDDGSDCHLKKLIEKGNKKINNGDTSFADTCPKEDDINILLFTSGTTGLAKGVMLSHKNIATNLMNMVSLVLIQPKDCFFSVLPLHHTYEATCGFLCPLFHGCSIAYCEGLKYIVKNMKEAKPTFFLAVPLIIESIYSQIWKAIEKKGKAKLIKKMLKITNFLLKFKIDLRKIIYKEIHENLGGKMHLFISGAAALDPDIISGMRAFGFNVIQGYGMTECSPIAAVNRDVYFDDASAGLPPIEVDTKIDNPNEEGIGEILLKGENVMVGYFENEEATANTIIDGWLHTGDMGYIDDRGFIYITGRLKNVIVTANGKNVYPEEVETYLQRSPYIAECMVYANTNEIGNETVITAQIYPDKEAAEETLGKDYTEEQLHALLDKEVKAVNKQMSSYKMVQKFEIRHEEFVKTTTKKIKRFANTH